jgi:hypothetical protein
MIDSNLLPRIESYMLYFSGYLSLYGVVESSSPAFFGYWTYFEYTNGNNREKTFEDKPYYLP